MKLPDLFRKHEHTVLEVVDVIHQYTADLIKLTALRDKARIDGNDSEAEAYDNIIDVAQETLITLVELSHKPNRRKE